MVATEEEQCDRVFGESGDGVRALVGGGTSVHWDGGGEKSTADDADRRGPDTRCPESEMTVIEETGPQTLLKAGFIR